MENLPTLNIKRGSIKSRITKFQSYLTNLSEFNDNVVLQLEVRLAKIEPLFEEFNKIQSEIELLDSSPAQDDERESFETSYFEAVTNAKSLIRDNSSQIITNRSSPVERSHEPVNAFKRNIRLPVLELKSFHGAYENWVSFQDTFTSLIHNDPDLPDIQKFLYLKSSLKEDALRVIDSLPVTSANYATAWSLLRGRYESKHLIINNHVQKLLNIPSLHKETLVGLRQLVSDVSTNLNALKTLDQPVDQWSTLLLHIVGQKLDPITLRDWESHNEDKVQIIPTMTELSEFLERRCKTLEKCKQSKQTVTDSRSSITKRERIMSNVATTSPCVICGSDHFMNNCKTFLDLSIEERIQRTRDLRLCLNCLKRNHTVRFCKSSRCKKCGRSHNTLLHLNTAATQAPPLLPTTLNVNELNNSSVTAVNGESSTVASHTVCGLSTQCLLSTVIINVRDNTGGFTEARALLDSGSQTCFISEALCTKLNLRRSKISTSVTGINQAATPISSKTIINIGSRINAFNTNINCLILPRVTHNIPLITFDQSQLNLPNDIKLADPTFHISDSIDILIGADLFWNILCVGQIKLGKNKPTLQKTLFGWVIAGPMSQLSPPSSTSIQCHLVTKSSNSPQLVETIENSSELLEIGDSDAKALGLWWNSSTDVFKFSIKNHDLNRSITKRTILSTTAQIFDPLGIIGPVTVIAKSILQKLWSLKIDWDESLPSNLHTQWIQFQTGLQSLNDLIVPRHVMCANPSIIEIHGFSDSSEIAYGAAIYIRSVDACGHVHVSLLCAKSRIAPLKNLNIPRLELCGALLLANLFDKVTKSLGLSFDSTYFWTDSTIVLGWINKPSNTWKTFVANRVAQIQTVTKIGDWHHVRSNDNPADLLSRGMYPQDIITSSLWWSGPKWLSENCELWPSTINSLVSYKELPEIKLVVPVVLTTQICDFNIFERYSSFSKLQRVVAYCFRFKNNCLNRSSRTQGSLTTDELKKSLNSLIKVCQMHTFADELRSLGTGKPLRTNSRLLTLHPFIDDQGVMRVGGRFLHSNFDANKKHPVVLPAKHHFTMLIATYEHARLLHAGPQALLASLRETFWPLSGPSLCKKVVNKCVRCFRVRPSNLEPIMGDLPKARLTPTRPFLVSGVDYAGPFIVKDRTGRGCKTSKAYFCIFVCFSTKAVHIELAPDLTTDSFLNSFKRFTARRGYCSDIYSDNGTNFVGANNVLSDLARKLRDTEFQREVLNYTTQRAIRWHFMPARSPTFGGLHEAAVKSAKLHIKRVIGDTILTFEQFYTFLTQVESCLNSRPLTALSSDPSDLTALTPGHFLIGQPLTALPQADLQDVPQNRLSTYQHLQQMVQHFWKRWSMEYLCQLQQRRKRTRQDERIIDVGTLVLLKEENLPPLKWVMGRISELHPGKDGVNRVVSVKTLTGVTRRAATKICVLPID